MSKRSSFFHIFFAVISIILSFIVVIFAKSVTVEQGFHWNFIRDTILKADFWLLSIVVAAALIVSYYSFYIIKRTRELNSTEFETKLKTYNERIKLKPSNFSQYIRENNFSEKTRVWTEKIEEKISKLELKYDRISNEKLNSPKAKKLKEKIGELKIKISEDFIKEKLIHTKVKYEELHAANFRKDLFGRIGSERKDFSAEKEIITKKMINRFITSLIGVGLVNALVIQCYMYFELNAGFWIILLSTLFMIIQNAFFGILTAQRIFQEEIVAVIENKTLILEDSVRWASGTPDKTFREIISDFIEEKAQQKEEKKMDIKVKEDNNGR